jgi:hypothetical protein
MAVKFLQGLGATALKLGPHNYPEQGEKVEN